MKLTNHDKKFISHAIDYFAKLFPIDDSAEFQNAKLDLEKLYAELEENVNFELQNMSCVMDDITSYHHFILGMRAYRAIQFTLDNPAQIIDLLYGADDTIHY